MNVTSVKFFPKPRFGVENGFTLVVTLALMILLTVIAVGLLTLSSVELRKSNQHEARAVAMANARMGLMMALGQLQQDLGDDRRISADASIFSTTKNPAAVGVWNGWSPDLASKSGSSTPPRVSYTTPKGQSGFRSWLVSSADPAKARQLSWHTSDPAGLADPAGLFTDATSGFSLTAEKVPCTAAGRTGTFAWAVTQENTKARINIGTDETKRISAQDQMQTPSRPDLTNSTVFKQPVSDWPKRSVLVCDMQQAALDPAYGVGRLDAARAAKDYTVSAASLLTDPVRGGLKVDLSTGFDMSETEFGADFWSTAEGSVKNPFRGTTSGYKGQRPLFQPMHRDPQVKVFMNFEPASVDHKFEVNGVPTFETLRSYYRIYRHLFDSNQGGTTAFERPYSHIASKGVPGRPFGLKSQPSLMPVVDRVYFILSVIAKTDGTLGVLVTPFVTIWNPHNVEVETEGLVVYPWIDFAVFWNYSISKKAGGSATWSQSLSRVVGEGYQGSAGERHGRSSRPYFYFHLTQKGEAVSPGTQVINPAIHLEPGEVRVFCLADTTRRDLDPPLGAAARTWRMKACGGPTDLTQSLKGGVFLNLEKALSRFSYRLQPGDVVNGNTVTFDRNSFNHITGVADSWQIRNPSQELMVSTRAADGLFPQLNEQPNLCFVGEIHSLTRTGGVQDSLSYPSYTFEEIRENPKMVGGVLTYHRTANTGTASTQTLTNSDLMFTTNPRQPFVNSYLTGGGFQTGPHYETLMIGGTSLVNLAMETSLDGKNAYYGLSHSSNKGRPNPVFFEIPRSPTLSLGSFQHCDISTTPYAVASQIGNSWASPYLPSGSASKLLSAAASGETISPGGLGVYDYSYLANEALFDSCYLSGAAPEFGTRKSAAGSPNIWSGDQISESRTTDQVLADFFDNPAAKPLRNPRMTPYRSTYSATGMKARLAGPAKCVRLAAHLLVEGGFNINSTSVEAWTAVLASLRGAKPASGDKTAQSRFRHILSGAPAFMKENDGWDGFRTLSDADIKTLAKNLVAEIKLRGPFLSLGEFVNRRVSSDRNMNLSGALQSAIEKSGLNRNFAYSTFSTANYPNPENLPSPNTGTNTPGWLSQADILHGLAPYITPRSDTFIIRSLGEAKSPDGKTTATVRLEAQVQRVPDWVDPRDGADTTPADLKASSNKNFGRQFRVMSVRELTLDPNGDPI